MTGCNPENERIKREYFQWCEKAKGMSPLTIGHAGRAIRHYEMFTGYKSFKTFNDKQATAFCTHLEDDDSLTTGKPLSISTRYATLVLVRAFFRWLASRSGYRQAIRDSDIDYLSVNRHERAIALHRKEPQPFPSCDQAVQVLRAHPTATDLELRDRAMIAFLLLTCARVDSVRSLTLKHVDLEQNNAFLNAAEVNTKRSKTFTIWFFPVDPLVRSIVADWISHLRDKLGFGDDDPLFPATAQVVGRNLQFTNDGLSRRHWKRTDPIRDIVKRRLIDAGQPYYRPHLFRKTIGQLGLQLCKSPEQLKVWSQNMGHDGVLTTLTHYSTVPAKRQAEIMRELGTANDTDADFAGDLDSLQRFIDKLRRG